MSTSFKVLAAAAFLFAAAPLCAPAAMAAGSKGAEENQTAKKVGLSWSAEVGVGYDSNIFRTPDASYVDYAQLLTPTIDPQVKSGFFVPVGANLKYLSSLGKTVTLITDYKLKADIYAESSATQYTHKFSIGPEFVLSRKKHRENTLYAGGFVGLHKETYFDRDDGSDKTTTTGADISNRYNYRSAGVEFEYKNRISALQYDVFGSIENRDYDDPVAVTQLDHTYSVLGGAVHYGLSHGTKLSLGYKYSVRDYDKRRALDSTGSALASNPTRKYSYNTVDFTVRQRVSDDWVGYFDYARETRSDKFVGYNDYTMNKYKVRAVYTPTDDLRFRLSARYWKRDYPDAFAFDNPAAGPKEYKGFDVEAKGEYAQTEHRNIWAGVNYDKQDTTDKRYEYHRYQAMVGVQYEY